MTAANPVHDAYRAFLAADQAWQAELTRLHGKRAGDVRYTKTGEGEPGSTLRALHDQFIAAGDEWRSLAILTP